MSAAREEILRRVRAALDAVVPSQTPVVAPVAAASVRRTRAAILDLFVERVADYRAVVERCAADELFDRVGAAVTLHAGPGARVVVPADLDLQLVGAVADDGLSGYDLDKLDGVVTRARVGIAETGTVVLDHGPGQGRRAITLVPDLHVCVVETDQVVPDVPDALAVLDPARPQTWISGPSATSDIEFDRVEGVHGPRTLHVLLVDARAPSPWPEEISTELSGGP